MKTKFLSILILCLSVSAFADGLTESSLVGQYSLTGNGGFLSYNLVFNSDGTIESNQTSLDGTVIFCHGLYRLKESSQNLLAVYNCPAGEVVTQETSLADVTLTGLQTGAAIEVRIKSSLGTDSTVHMVLTRK